MNQRLIVIISVVVISFLLTSCTSVQAASTNVFEPSAISDVDRNVLFTLSKPWSISNIENPEDIGARSASLVLDGIPEICPEGVDIVESIPLYYTEAVVSISQIHVIEDRDYGPGEVYLVTLLNSYYENTHDNGGSYYVVNDGNYVSTSISVSQMLYSLDGHFSVEIHGWEDDTDMGTADDYLGGELLYFDLTDLETGTASGWWSFDYYPSIGGNNVIQIEAYVSVTFSNTQLKSYPEDFQPIPYNGATLLAAAYLPEVYYDTLDGGNNPGIDCIYYQAYYGYDPEIMDYCYVIYYMFYYTHETDNFGLLFGHYYDYEPFLIYIRDIGDVPYRIVYRDVGQYTLPPKVIIQDYYESPSSGSVSVETSGHLRPLLGASTAVTYQYRTTYWNDAARRTITGSYGCLPLYKAPIMTITNTYHQMELGLVFNRAEADIYLSDLVLMSDDVLRTGYLRLDEAFDSSVNVYEGVSLWNGGDYVVPTNMSLTLDMLHDPFQFPYLIDCWEDVAHYTQSAKNIKQTGFTYDMDLELRLEIPATVTLSLPDQVMVNNHYDIDLAVTMHPDDIILRFIYDIDIGYNLQWWYLDFDKHSTFDGQFEFKIPLQTIHDTLSRIELDDDGVSTRSLNNYVTIREFETSTDLLGTMLEAEVEIHLLTAIKDLLNAVSGLGNLLEILSLFIDEVELIACPVLSGQLTATLSTTNGALALDQSEVSFSSGDTTETIGMNVVGGYATSGICIENMIYHMEFATDWDVEFDFSDAANIFADDFSIHLGRFPDITMSSDENTIDASATTGFDNPMTMAIAGTGLSLDSSSMLLVGALVGIGGVVAVGVIILIRRRGSIAAA